MKKIITVLFIISLLFLISSNNKNVVIPKNSIRYRIIANSNSKEDQKQKANINSLVMPQIINAVNNSSDIDDARKNINKIIPNLKSELDEKNIKYQIKYGINHFPEKEYKGVIYKEDDYESLVISLDNAMGDNWWCVLFPPLCLLEATENESNNVNYAFYIKEIINNYK